MIVHRTHKFLDKELKCQIGVSKKILNRKTKIAIAISKKYYDSKVDDAIIKYNLETNTIKRNELYNGQIRPYLLKLIVSTVKMGFKKYTHIDEYLDEIVCDIESHLIKNFDKINNNRGKSYSYFTVVVRNYLIQNNEYNYKNKKQNLSIDEKYQFEDYANIDTHFFHNLKYVEKYNGNFDNKEFINDFCKFADTQLNLMFAKTYQVNIAYAILHLLYYHNELIENLNKKTFYIFMREMTKYKTVHITKVLNKIKELYFNYKRQYLNLYY